MKGTEINMNIGIVGLGLIGGSMAKALKTYTDNKVYGWNRTESVTDEAISINALDDKLTEATLPCCHLIIVSLYPEATIDYIKKNAHLISKDAVVIDCGGVKRLICDALEPIAEEYGFTFIGAHPMAGLHMSGFAYASEDLFQNASLVLCPNEKVKHEKVDMLRDLFTKTGFTNIQIATPVEHDRIIAYTSQLCHVVSNAYVKNDAATLHKGFSAGSYRDLTRVAKLNENMWTELFFENDDYLQEELDELIENLIKYREALKTGNKDNMNQLLKEGRERKEDIDGLIYRN